MFKANLKHPYEMSVKEQNYFDYVELMIYPELYFAIRIYREDRKIFVGKNEIQLSPRLFDDFLYIAQETIKNSGVLTYHIEKSRRNFKTKSRLKSNAVYKNISQIKKIFKETLNNSDPIITRANNKYHINIDLSKPHSLLIA